MVPSGVKPLSLCPTSELWTKSTSTSFRNCLQRVCHRERQPLQMGHLEFLAYDLWLFCAGPVKQSEDSSPHGTPCYCTEAIKVGIVPEVLNTANLCCAYTTPSGNFQECLVVGAGEEVAYRGLRSCLSAETICILLKRDPNTILRSWENSDFIPATVAG